MAQRTAFLITLAAAVIVSSSAVITLFYNSPKITLSCSFLTSVNSCNTASGCAWYACAHTCHPQGTPTGDVCPSQISYCRSFSDPYSCSQHSNEACSWSQCYQSCLTENFHSSAPCVPTATSIPPSSTPTPVILRKSTQIITRTPLALELTLPVSTQYTLASEGESDWGIYATLPSGTSLHICEACQQFINGCDYLEADNNPSCTSTQISLGNFVLDEYRTKKDPGLVAAYRGRDIDRDSLGILILTPNQTPLSANDRKTLGNIFSSFRLLPQVSSSPF